MNSKLSTYKNKFKTFTPEKLFQEYTKSNSLEKKANKNYKI